MTLTQSVHWFFTTLVTALGTGSYPAIFALMAVESTVVPLPSELVLIPAGYLAYKGGLNVYAVVATGLAGSLVGALISYGVSLWLGRPLLERFGRFFFLPPHKLHHVEGYFARHGEITTFVARLLPGIRHLIGIPAGLCRMRLGKFTVFTALGAGLWSGVLTAFGYWVASKEQVWEQAWQLYGKRISGGLVSFVGLLLVSYVLYHRAKHRSEDKRMATADTTSVKVQRVY